MKFCPDCGKAFPYGDVFEEDYCPDCSEVLEDVDEFTETPFFYCSNCGAEDIGFDVPVSEDGESYICPECGSRGSVCVWQNEE